MLDDLIVSTIIEQMHEPLTNDCRRTTIELQPSCPLCRFYGFLSSYTYLCTP